MPVRPTLLIREERVYVTDNEGTLSKRHSCSRFATPSDSNDQEYATILERRQSQVYVHYVNQDKRLDEWVDEADCRPADDVLEGNATASQNQKRRTPAFSRPGSSRPGSYSDDALLPQEEDGPPITEEELDIKHHKQITAQRNFETVHFGKYQIKTW
jgi:histone acetyltransferase HTATIP/histone acetyltransferase MYST1